MLRLVLPLGLILSLSVASANGLSCIYILTGDQVRYSPLTAIYGNVDTRPRSQMYSLGLEKLKPTIPEKFSYNPFVVNGKTLSHKFDIQLKDTSSLQTELMKEMGIEADITSQNTDSNETVVHIDLPIPEKINEKLGLEVGKSTISFLATAYGISPEVRARFLAEGIVTVSVDEIHTISESSYQRLPGFYKLSKSAFWPRIKSVLKNIFLDIDKGNIFSPNLNRSLSHREKILMVQEIVLAVERTAVLMSDNNLSKIETVRNLMTVMTEAEAKLMRNK